MANEGNLAKLQGGFIKTAGRIAASKLLLTLRDSFILIASASMIAGFATMLSSVFIDPANGLVFGKQGLQIGRLISGSWTAWADSGFYAGLQSTQSIIALIANGSLNLFSLLIVMVFSYILSRRYYPKNKEHMISVLYAMGAFFICVPWQFDFANNEQTVNVTNAISGTYLGTQGVFAALVISGAAVVIYNEILKRNITIKMPESVPPAVARSFESLVPGLATMLFFVFATSLSHGLAGKSVPDLMLYALQKPALAVSRTAAFAFVSQFTWSLLQWFGIHPSSIWSPIFGLTWNINDTQNMLGQAHHLYSTIFMNFSTVAAGTCSLAPVLAIIIASHQKSDKKLSKIALMPAVFNISEPITFGLPIVLNPLYAIPFIIAQPLCFYIAVFFTQIGFVGVITNSVPWTVPTILSGLLFTGSINGAIVQAINLTVATLIWIPFVKMSNRINLRKSEQITASDQAA
ncbi:PTS system, lactose/cellobiose family IIC subunit [Coriobacterium glomerans PW2]|uniref:Permease IIC component n=1 Tax=Coriobacterium glomerans (strain ATCC 49209 / DSM 20642 / JCM 10262 / PW2) TaxID=700015 RepID=F2NB40_CORGP|nr:PTS transporter subunit EIIC [Coriobacterium glomerans]AEB07791.1 PTS system, lactose/cellobiose family IIC subunit [Coriobacterium glomerans PW2]